MGRHEPNFLHSTIHYLPQREALLVEVDLSNYLIDYYIHRQQYGEGVTSVQDERLKELIACFAIHLSVRPSTESHAWTVHMISEPPYSLFVTGAVGSSHEPVTTGKEAAENSMAGYLVGTVLTDHIRHTDINSLQAQFTDKTGNSFRSFVKGEVAEVWELIEHFYRQSEQHPLRISLSQTSDKTAAIVALPGFDKDWFHAIDIKTLLVDESEARKILRTEKFEFRCDCSPNKLLPFFRSLPEEDLTELYGADDELIIHCPRCGKNFAIQRKELYSSQ